MCSISVVEAHRAAARLLLRCSALLLLHVMQVRLALRPLSHSNHMRMFSVL